MAQTVVSTSSPLNPKRFSVGLFAESIRRSSMLGKLFAPVSKQAQAEAKIRGRSRTQSPPDMPVVVIRDLVQQAGDTVTIDLVHLFRGKPIMGDKKASGKGEQLTLGTDEIKINQYRKVADPGGKMTRRRTEHNLKSLSMANLGDYFSRLKDQLCLVHLAGARGTEDTEDWVVPPDDDEDFDDIMVNALTPPTPDRRFFGGDATSVANLAATDYLVLNDLDRIRAILDEMVFPPAPCKIPGDMVSEENPLYIMYVTSRQWLYLQVTTSKYGNDWRTFLANAEKRNAMKRHPLFLGETGIWNGILVRKMQRAVRFATGATVRQYNAAGTAITNATAAVDTDRAIILGGQALGYALGNAGEPGDSYPVGWEEEISDGGNALELFAFMVTGLKKIKFKGSDGVTRDHGVMTMDTYAPDPNGTVGQALVGTLSTPV